MASPSPVLLLRPIIGMGRGNFLVLIFKPLGQVFDIVGRPIGDFHAEVEAHGRQHFLDLVERLAAEVRRAQHFGFGLLNEIADVDDVVVLQAISRAHRQF